MEEEIRYIQSLLRDISFFDESVERIIPDGIYGEQTESSVRSFQRSRGLNQTGSIDNDTWDKIVEEHREIHNNNQSLVCARIIDEFSLPIEVGESGNSVFVIQAMMLALSNVIDNIEPVEITGINDAATGNVAAKIMLISGIEPKGSLDREFINALTELYSVYVTRDNVKNSSFIG